MIPRLPHGCYRRFHDQTSIELGPNCGIDTETWRGLWHGVSPKTEIVLADFVDARQRRQAEELGPLFAIAAE